MDLRFGCKKVGYADCGRDGSPFGPTPATKIESPPKKTDWLCPLPRIIPKARRKSAARQIDSYYIHFIFAGVANNRPRSQRAKKEKRTLDRPDWQSTPAYKVYLDPKMILSPGRRAIFCFSRQKLFCFIKSESLF